MRRNYFRSHNRSGKLPSRRDPESRNENDRVSVTHRNPQQSMRSNLMNFSQNSMPAIEARTDRDMEGKATRIRLWDFSSAPMRAFHLSWFAFFLCFVAWFGIAPLMAIVR